MPRKPRVISSTGIYHIILRSVNQHIIFEEDSDYQKFLYILSDCKTKYDIDIFAYCLMDNHIHLLLYSMPDSLSSFFQSLGTRFARWYNTKYLRSGHLFQDRFYSSVVEDVPHYLSTLVYIHNNPVKANICQNPSEYRWSSYNAFYGQKNPLINISFSHDIAGSKDLLITYFSKHCDGEASEYFYKDHLEVTHHLTDDQALQIFKAITKLSSASEVQFLPKRIRNDYIRSLKQNRLTQKQIARLMDVSITTVKRICSK